MNDAWPTLEAVELRHVLDTCDRYGWNLTRVAVALGISPKTVYTKLHRCESLGLVSHINPGWERLSPEPRRAA